MCASDLGLRFSPGDSCKDVSINFWNLLIFSLKGVTCAPTELSKTWLDIDGGTVVIDDVIDRCTTGVAVLGVIGVCLGIVKVELTEFWLLIVPNMRSRTKSSS